MDITHGSLFRRRTGICRQIFPIKPDLKSFQNKYILYIFKYNIEYLYIIYLVVFQWSTFAWHEHLEYTLGKLPYSIV